MKSYRNNGAIGALLDEYEKSVLELNSTLIDISKEELVTIVDPNTEDEDCRSIQSILSHVVKAGHWYNIEIKNALGESIEPPEIVKHDSITEYQEGLIKLINSTEVMFTKFSDMDIYAQREFRWKHIYNIDMLVEHAIVHILRHRRQIERYKIKLRAL